MIHASLRPRAAFAMLFGALACGRADRAAAGVTVRDSAGVRIVESSAPAWTPATAWRVGTEASLDLGAAEGDPAQQFERVVAALRLPDGRIVVADAGVGQLRWFDAAGRHQATAGRKGGGPGEFRTMDWVGAAGDSVFVWDRAHGRLTVFDPRGRLARAVRPRALGAGAEVVGRMGSGALVATPGFVPPKGGTGVRREPVTWMALTSDGARARRLGEYPGMETFAYPYATLSLAVSLAFGHDVHFAGAKDGYWAGDDARYEVVLYAPDGSPRRRVRRAHTPVAVTPQDLDAVLRDDQRITGMPAGMAEAMRQGQRTMRRAVPRNRTFPAFGGLLVNAGDHLWVEEYRRPGDEQPRWSVFDPEGRWLGTVETPAGFTVHQVGADWILGVETDELEVEHVRMYPLITPAR